jgi:hypothetical protein
MHTHTPAAFRRLVDASMGFCCGTQSSKKGELAAAKCVLPFWPSCLRLSACPARFVICSVKVLVCSVLFSNFALYRYAEMKREVSTVAFPSVTAVAYGASSESRPTSSTDWTYCAFIEQLQRIAEQLSAQIEGAFVGTFVCTIFHIILQMSSTAIISRFLISSPRRVLPVFT